MATPEQNPLEVTVKMFWDELKDQRKIANDQTEILIRLEERSSQHDKRIGGIEKRGAIISLIGGFFAAIGVQVAGFFGITFRG